MDIDITAEPGPGIADKSVDSKNQTDSDTEIPRSSSESMQVVQDKFDMISTGLVGLDIGFLTAEFHSQSDIENYVTRGHIDFLLTMPKDSNNQTFPDGILKKLRNINADQHSRDWLVWSQHEESLCCFTCRLFWNSVFCRLSSSSKSALATAEGWSVSAKWRKLCNRVLEHEMGNGHRQCYLAWREFERRQSLQGFDNLLEVSIKVESEKLYISKRIIDITLFIGERRLAYKSTSQRIGN